MATSCPKCRGNLVLPSKDQEQIFEQFYCPKCNVFYGEPLHLKGIPIKEIGCFDKEKNIFFAKLDDMIFTVRQSSADDYEDIKEALKLASEYTYLRYPSPIWEHPQGICNLPRFKKDSLGAVYFIMKVNKEIVGFSHHNYWILGEKTKKKEGFPVPVGSKIVVAQLCILDPYQRQGVGSLYAKVSNYIAKYNGADFIMGETFKTGGMLNIRLKDGWDNYGERVAEDGSTRILIGKPLSGFELKVKKNDISENPLLASWT